MKLTSELLDEVLSNQYEYRPRDYRDFKDVSHFLRHQIKQSQISKKQLLVAIDISESIGYKYIDGSRAVNRDTFIKFLLAFNFTLADIQYHLINFGFGSLYIKNKRDSAIIHGIVNGYSYLELKQYLTKHKIKSL